MKNSLISLMGLVKMKGMHSSLMGLMLMVENMEAFMRESPSPIIYFVYQALHAANHVLGLINLNIISLT